MSHSAAATAAARFSDRSSRREPADEAGNDGLSVNFRRRAEMLAGAPGHGSAEFFFYAVYRLLPDSICGCGAGGIIVSAVMALARAPLHGPADFLLKQPPWLRLLLSSEDV